jgi:hypothetical protein
VDFILAGEGSIGSSVGAFIADFPQDDALANVMQMSCKSEPSVELISGITRNAP